MLKAVAHLTDGTTQDVTGGTQWTLSNATLAGLRNGTLIANSPGVLTVQAAYLTTDVAGSSSASAKTTPETLSASTRVTIAATPSANTASITWRTPATIVYGTALSGAQLNATSNVPGSLEYTPGAGTVLKAGTQTLSVHFVPTDAGTYAAATSTVQLSVAQAAPVIKWPAPATIVEGTNLSSVQLDAQASVAGKFTYSPGSGTVPAAGTQQLSVTFTPTDANDYSSATVHNSIVVTASAGSPIVFGYTGSPLVATLRPPNPTSAVSSKFFGMTIEHTFTPFPSFPIATQRFWDVDPWAKVEPSNGDFVWADMDASIARAQEHGGNDFIYTFGNVPAWASTNPSQSCADGPGTCAPPDMTAFDDFATQVIQRYCGTIKYYETWNEPNNQKYWSGTNAQLLTVAQHLYRLAKDPANCGCTNGVCARNNGANPNQVLMPPISRVASYSLSWLDSYLNASGTQYPYADVVAFHGYGATNPEDIVTQVQSLDQILAKHGLSNLQLWDTEADWGPMAQVGQQQASWLMRYHVALATTRVSRFVWYAYDNCSWGTLWEGYCPNPQMTIERVTEGGTAYAAVESWLSGAILSSCQQYENGLWICALQRASGYQAWILWSSTGTAISVPIPEGQGLSVYRDWQNNAGTLPTELSVDQMPVLLETHDL